MTILGGSDYRWIRPPLLQGWGKNGKSTPESRERKNATQGARFTILRNQSLCSHGGVVALVGVVESVWAKKHTVKYYLQATCKREIGLGNKTDCQGSFHEKATVISSVSSFALKCSKLEDKIEWQNKTK